MDTFLSIALNSVLVLAGMLVAAAAFTFLGVWLSDQTQENGGH